MKKENFLKTFTAVLLAALMGTSSIPVAAEGLISPKKNPVPAAGSAKTQDEEPSGKSDTAQVQQPAKSYATVKERFNDVELHPKKANSRALSSAISKILKKVTTDDMEPYDKLMACYDFLVTYMNSEESPGIQYPSEPGYYNMFMTPEEEFAKIGIKNGFKGVCVHYAGILYLLARAIGYDATFISGETLAAGGGYTEHKWIEINANGQTFILDAYLEQTFMGSQTEIPHQFFCTTYETQGKRFVPMGTIKRQVIKLPDGRTGILVG